MTTMKQDDEELMPSTLIGKPIRVLAPPGRCQFTEDFTSVPLLNTWKISDTSSVLRFGLPDPTQPLNLSTCACVIAMAHVPQTVIRPYTPISTNDQIGSFDLLVKDYGEGTGPMSNYLCNMSVGSHIKFKHVDNNVKMQAPFPLQKVAMIVGGTGITPMIQALHATLGTKYNKTQISMLYGSRTSKDILGKELLDSWSDESRLTVTHVLSHEPEDSEWDGKRGYINQQLIEEHFPKPEENNFRIFVCGPPPMYNALCGPRSQKELTGVLYQMGYKAEQVYKY